MYSKQEAISEFLSFINEGKNEGSQEEFIVNKIELSDKKDYWVIAANAKPDCPQAGGVYGFLLDVHSGEVICPGYEGTYGYLTDKYDEDIASGKTYVLTCGFSFDDKVSIVNLRKNLGIPYAQTVKLVKDKRYWAQGKKRYLQDIEIILLEKGISCEIILVDGDKVAKEITSDYWWWEKVREHMKDVSTG